MREALELVSQQRCVGGHNNDDGTAFGNVRGHEDVRLRGGNVAAYRDAGDAKMSRVP